jgi:hypothetical protein
MTGRSTEPSTIICIQINRKASPIQLPSCPLPGLYLMESAQCWFNTTSNFWVCRTKNCLLCPVKYHQGLRTPGVYRIPCECDRVYIGQAGHSVDIRLKEHQQQIWLEHPDKSAIAQYSIDQRHCIQFTVLPSSPRKPAMRTALLGRPLRLNSTHTISMERVASVSVNHGSFLSAP